MASVVKVCELEENGLIIQSDVVTQKLVCHAMWDGKLEAAGANCADSPFFQPAPD